MRYRYAQSATALTSIAAAISSHTRPGRQPVMESAPSANTSSSRSPIGYASAIPTEAVSPWASCRTEGSTAAAATVAAASPPINPSSHIPTRCSCRWAPTSSTSAT